MLRKGVIGDGVCRHIFFSVAATILKISLYIAGTIVVLSVLLFLVSGLPKQPLFEHLRESSLQGDFDNNYPKVFFQFRTIDLYTECVGIGIAAVLQPNMDRLIRMDSYGFCPGLKQAIADGFPEPSGHYARYVHGYQIFLKPLYTLFDRDQASVVIGCLTLAFFVFFFIAAYKRLGLVYALALIASFAFLRSAHVFTLATHAVQFWVVVGGCIAVFFNHNRNTHIYIFAVVGAMDAYMTFLSMGSLSLGMALLCLCLSLTADGEEVRKTLLLAFCCCLAWSFGFLAVWLLKWGLALWHLPDGTVLMGDDLVQRYSTQNAGMVAKAITNNINRTARWLWVPAYILLALRLLFVVKKFPRGLWVLLFPALVPFAWMCLLPGQSRVNHAFFVYIILWPALASILLLLLAYPIKKTGQAASGGERITPGH